MNDAIIINGDALHIPLADNSVQCCVTSPPYFGLRDYGTAKWEGGDQNCDHKKPFIPRNNRRKEGCKLHSTSDESIAAYQPVYKDICGKCGAIRIDDQIGLEQTPEAYVAKLVDVFREVRRVLKDDGTLWLNLGDSYAGSSMSGGDQTKRVGGGTNRLLLQHESNKHIKLSIPDDLKPKDLIGIPWRVAFALQADGWYLRQDIIWAKPNPMPESVTDRCTKSHEYIFMLSKQGRYYYDQDAIKEVAINGDPTSPRGSKANIHKNKGLRSKNIINDILLTTRNRRSVWTVTTSPYPEAHFATFPPKLIEPCILAGSRPGDVILDPFNGSGTTGYVSIKHNRKYVGIELNLAYIRLSHKRISGTQRMLV
jgi:DNA modification methylase